MTTKKDRIDREVARTLDLLDHTERIEAGPWLLGRVRQRIRTAQTSTGGPGFSVELLRPALLALVVLLNLTTVLMTFYHERSSERRASVETLISEYQFTGPDGLLDSYARSVEP